MTYYTNASLPQYTAESDAAVRIAVENTSIAAALPRTILDIVEETCRKAPQQRALGWETSSGVWSYFTYKEYITQIYECARALLDCGLQRHKAVCIMGFNSPEWIIANFGAIFAGGHSAGVYTTNNADVTAFVARDCKAQIFIVDDDEQVYLFICTYYIF